MRKCAQQEQRDRLATVLGSEQERAQEYDEDGTAERVQWRPRERDGEKGLDGFVGEYERDFDESGESDPIITSVSLTERSLPLLGFTLTFIGSGILGSSVDER